MSYLNLLLEVLLVFRMSEENQVCRRSMWCQQKSERAVMSSERRRPALTPAFCSMFNSMFHLQKFLNLAPKEGSKDSTSEQKKETWVEARLRTSCRDLWSADQLFEQLEPSGFVGPQTSLSALCLLGNENQRKSEGTSELEYLPADPRPGFYPPRVGPTGRRRLLDQIHQKHKNNVYFCLNFLWSTSDGTFLFPGAEPGPLWWTRSRQSQIQLPCVGFRMNFPTNQCFNGFIRRLY